MKIHEYQAKDLFRQYGIPTQAGALARTPEEAEAKARFEAGSARASLDARLALDVALDALERSDRLERWSLVGSLAREGTDSVARAGLAYRF